jgi:hypothetical protein
MEEEQTTQWPTEKGQKDKQRSTKHSLVTQVVLLRRKKSFIKKVLRLTLNFASALSTKNQN